MYGFVVCYSNLVDRKPFQEPYRSYSTRLTGYLQTNPDSIPESVDVMLLKIANPPFAKTVHRPPTPNESAQASAAKWGVNNDGDEWRGTSSFQLGYVQGFLECYSKHTKHTDGIFSRPPEWYVKAIAEWYGTGINPEKINATRQHDKIPDVLFRFPDENEN